MVVLLLMVAMVVDAGMAYAEKAQLQNGADAAALAVAGDCANNTACTATGELSLAVSLANGNSNDGTSQVSLTISGGVVTSTTSTISGGNHFLSFPLAGLTGHATGSVQAVAQASWGGPKSGPTVLPVTFGACELNPMDGIDRKIVVHGSGKCSSWNPSAGLNMPGGFGWLDVSSGCKPNISIDNPWVDSKTGASIPGGCDGLFSPSLVGTTVLVPIFGFADGTGANGTYKIIGWGVLLVKGWNFPSTTVNWPYGKGTKGIYGHFVKKLSFADGFTWGGTTVYGALEVKLIK